MQSGAPQHRQGTLPSDLVVELLSIELRQEDPPGPHLQVRPHYGVRRSFPRECPRGQVLPDSAQGR